MIAWFEHNYWFLMGLSVALFIAGLLGLCLLAIYLPPNYFLPKTSPPKPRHPLIRLLLRIIKNTAGAILLALGFILALPLIPGPGFMFLLLGLSLLDLPGKRKLERYLLSRPMILHPLNSLRHKFHRPPLNLPPSQQSPSPPHA